MPSYLDTVKSAGRVTSTSDRILAQLESSVHEARLVSPSHGEMMLGFESLSMDDRTTLRGVGENLQTALIGMQNALGLPAGTPAQMAAAEMGALMAGNWRKHLQAKPRAVGVQVGVENFSEVSIDWGSFDYLSDRPNLGMEAYDDTDNARAVTYTITYNYQAARQDIFCETHFPTITIDSQNNGIAIEVDLMMIYENVQRQITGDVSEFYMKNIIRAVVDPSLLKKEATRMWPIYRQQNKKYLSDTVAAKTIKIEGESITIAPIKFGEKFDWLALSQTDELIKLGVMDQTDSINPSAILSDIYLQFGQDIIRFDTTNCPYNNFVPNGQNNSKLGILNFMSQSIVISDKTKQHDGSDLVSLKPIVDAKMFVVLDISINGSMNMQKGDTFVTGGLLGVDRITDGNAELDMTTGAAASIKAIIEGGKFDSLYIKSYRANLNRRQRGQFIDQQRYRQIYQVPHLSPITTLRPINSDGVTDASDVQALVTTTRVRIQNDGVAFLLRVMSTLAEYTDVRDNVGAGPDVLGVGRFFVRAKFLSDELNVSEVIANLKSVDVPFNIRATLINRIRDMVYTLWRDSEYQPAADQLSGGTAPVPTVVLGTDPYIAQYLMYDGELRTLGDQFQLKTVATWNKEMRGKIAITFHVFDENRNTAVNPLNFANLLWAPESVLAANISRGNTTSKETTAAPRYLHANHCPIGGLLHVSGIPEVAMNRIPLSVLQLTQ